VTLPVLPDPALSRAILIGTSHFEHRDQLQDLPAVQRNLTALAGTLTDPVHGILTEEHCAVLRDPASPKSFMQALQTAVDQASDLLLVYYAGHGLRHGFRDQFCLTVEETDPVSPNGSAVSYEWVRDAFESSRARVRLLILDCCHSGMAVGIMSAATPGEHDTAIRGTSVIASSSRDEVSFALEGERYSAFSGELIRLLQNGSPRFGEPLTIDALYGHLRAALSSRGLPRPARMSRDNSSELLLRRPAPPMPPIPPAQISLPPWNPVALPFIPMPTTPDVFTIPAMSPVLPPLVFRPPAAATSEPRRRRVFSMLMVDSGWLVLWTGLAVGLSFIVGGYSAAIAEGAANPVAAGNDRAGGAAGIALFVVCGLLIGLRIMRVRKKGRRLPSLGELSPTLDAKLSKVRQPLLIAALVCCLAVAVGGALTPLGPQTSDPGSVSSLATSVALVFLLVEGALACAYALYRRRRSAQVIAVEQTST
jgi:hypothetical protein